MNNTTELRQTTDQEREAMEYLNELRISGATNMFGAAPFVEADFGVTRKEAIRLLTLWMENFNE
jgi:hypothetical protein